MPSERAGQARALRAKATTQAERAKLDRTERVDDHTTSAEFKKARRRSAYRKALSAPFVPQQVETYLLSHAGCVALRRLLPRNDITSTPCPVHRRRFARRWPDAGSGMTYP
jgi:hypothetical protein